MANKSITKNGQTVLCHGEWGNDTTAECAFDNDLFDCEYFDGPDTWEEAVENMTQFAVNNRIILLEMVVTAR
jgi:hypothetical protein